MKLDLENKVVLVADTNSDSATGIIAVLKSEGAVAVCCLDEGQAEPAGCDAAYHCNLSDLAQAEALRDGLAQRFGRLDGVIFHHLQAEKTTLLTQSADGFIARLAQTARAAFICAKVFGGYMGSLHGGALVYVTTQHDEKPTGRDFVHSIGQGMMENLVMEASMEYGQLGVRVNQVAMGPVEGAYEQFKSDITTFYEGCCYKIPLCRLGTWEDLANTAVFLCSARSAFTNGARVQLDGALVHHYIDPRANFRAHEAERGVK